jgi:TolB protein
MIRGGVWIVERNMTVLQSLPGYSRLCRLSRGTAAIIIFFISTCAHADIIFTAKVLGPVSNIYAQDEAGRVRKITDNIHWRDLDPDRRKGWITFSSNREKEPKVDLYRTRENYHVYVVRDSGKSLQKITDGPHDNVVPKLSPDGKRVGYLHQAPEKHELRVVGRNGRGGRTLDRADTILDLSWSPDGEMIAYAPTTGTESALMTVKAGGGEPRTLVKVSLAEAPAGAENEEGFLAQIVSVKWSPDGNRIAYIRHPFRQGSVRQLRVFDLKTGRDFAVSEDAAQVQHPVTWSADGGRILYSALVGYKFYYDEKVHKKVYEGGMHIFISALDGDKVVTRQLTQGDFLFKSPAFSPDEKRIAFLYADELDERTLSLRTMNIEGADVRELYNSVAQYSSLQWQ